MIRPARSNFRPLLAALLSLAVLASPVMSANACALACAAGQDKPEVVPNDAHKCCATKHASHPSESQPQPSKNSDQRDDDCTHCAAMCCRQVTAIDNARAPIVGEALALSVESATVVAHDFVTQKLIFHPPRA